MKVSIDPTRCRGHALCLTIAPEAFEFIALEDRSTVKPGAESIGPADAVLAKAVLAAARECPEQAIVVELDDQDEPSQGES
jgi:ferredoxin